MNTPSPINLHFEDSGHWYSLPEWAEYFIDIGKQLAYLKNTNARTVTAVVVPTRAFGAAFVSLGMVISDVAARDRLSEVAHFEMLFDSPPGTPVIYRKKPGRVLRGILQLPGENNGELCVRVQVHSKEGGEQTLLIKESSALKVQLAKHSGRLPKKQGSNTRFINEFVEGLLGEMDPVERGMRSKVTCAIVGQKSILEHEIRQTPLAIHLNGQRYVGGQLQDVLRVDKFVALHKSHRSALVVAGGDTPSSDVIDSTEIGVVYDGAAGFLKWGNLWGKSHQVLILDRTERLFSDAINEVNSRFSQDSIQSEEALPVTEAPLGGEILSFWEARKQ
ncbi:MAG: hypothetical protein PVH19_03725 [Planctomycetia bacterium]|jgi:hypothetical protein